LYRSRWPKCPLPLKNERTGGLGNFRAGGGVCGVLHGSGGEADLCADGFGDTPSVVLVEIQDFAVNAVQCRPLKCG